jgi:hypothetical protein
VGAVGTDIVEPRPGETDDGRPGDTVGGVERPTDGPTAPGESERLGAGPEYGATALGEPDRSGARFRNDVVGGAIVARDGTALGAVGAPKPALRAGTEVVPGFTGSPRVIPVPVGAPDPNGVAPGRLRPVLVGVRSVRLKVDGATRLGAVGRSVRRGTG